MTTLADKVCEPCRTGTPPLSAERSAALVNEITGWSVVDNHHIEKTFRFRDFAEALRFVNAVGATAEAQGHHPEIALSWGKARVTIWTHKAGGLTESDFILAARIDVIPSA